MDRTRQISIDLGPEAPSEEGLGSILKADGTIAAGGAGKSYDSGRALLDTARG